MLSRDNRRDDIGIQRMYNDDLKTNNQFSLNRNSINMMFLSKAFIFSALLAVCLAKSVSEKPKHIKDYSERIVGGAIADRGQFPHQVQLQVLGTHSCGGAIINENWIVTAAHCAGGVPIGYTIVANQYNIYASEGEEQKHGVSRIVIHPDYDTAGYPNDIALMKLATPIILTDSIKPISLPPANHTPPDGYTSIVSGWGSLTEGGVSPRFLHFVEVPFVSDAQCNEDYLSTGEPITDSMICAGVGGKDACQGDSGGPLISDDIEAGSFYLSGVVSWGQGCAREGFPGVYTEVSKFVDWIQATAV